MFVDYGLREVSMIEDIHRGSEGSAAKPVRPRPTSSCPGATLILTKQHEGLSSLLKIFCIVDALNGGVPAMGCIEEVLCACCRRKTWRVREKTEEQRDCIMLKVCAV